MIDNKLKESEPLLVRRNRSNACLSQIIWILSLTLCASILVYSFFVIQLLTQQQSRTRPVICSDQCKVELVESIPEGLVFNSSIEHLQTHEAWSLLIKTAQESIEIGSMYWSLRGKDIYEDKSDWAGEQVYKELAEGETENIYLNSFNLFKYSFSVVESSKVSVRIAQNKEKDPNHDTEELKKLGAKLRTLDFSKLMGAGVLHTKLWIVDRKHFYVGSANFDWRSLTQVKELGVLVRDCECLAEDMAKIWQVYWDLGDQDSVPHGWPDSYSTSVNSHSPMVLPGQDMSVYLSSSPPPFCPQGRDKDLDAILHVIQSAEKYVHIAVMDYFPYTIYTRPPHFWPAIDDALRAAALERGVRVKLLASHWDHTRPAMLRFLRSLADLAGDNPKVDIQVKLFTVPAFTPEQKQIPFARVNHNKYMVTDKNGYIGTSNWSGDYFISTGGIGFVFTGKLSQQLEDVFTRDWTSSYAAYVSEH